MPFKSKAQQRFMFAAESRGELPKGTAENWAKHTPNIKKLPERKKSVAWNQGFKSILRKLGFFKMAGVLTLGIEGEFTPEVIEFLHKNPNPSDDTFHAWAEANNIEKDKAETAAYQIATTLINGFLYQGKAFENNKTEKDFDPEQIAKGIKVEKEHTNNAAIAKRIAMDHLTEIPDYYTRLATMEDAAKKSQK